jgi:hypothetical protein
MFYGIICLVIEMANRQTRRKQGKTKNKYEIPVYEEKSPKLLKMSILVGGIIIVFYFVTLLLTGQISFNNGKSDNNDEDNNLISIQYDEILAGETFKMNDSEYYVLFYDFEDSIAKVFDIVLNNYKNLSSHLKVYKVNLHNGMNTSYVSTTSNPNANKIEDLKIKGSTLIKIANGSKASYIEGKDAIKAALK